ALARAWPPGGAGPGGSLAGAGGVAGAGGSLAGAGGGLVAAGGVAGAGRGLAGAGAGLVAPTRPAGPAAPGRGDSRHGQPKTGGGWPAPAWSRCSPRAHSAAAIRRLPGGCTSPSSTGRVAVPANTPARPAHSSPGARAPGTGGAGPPPASAG